MTMTMQQTVRQVVLAAVRQDGWRHPEVRVAWSRARDKMTITVAFSASGEPDPALGPTWQSAVERVVHRGLAELMAQQTPELAAAWPASAFTIRSLVVGGATHTGTTIIRMDGHPSPHPVGNPPWNEP